MSEDIRPWANCPICGGHWRYYCNTCGFGSLSPVKVHPGSMGICDGPMILEQCPTCLNHWDDISGLPIIVRVSEVLTPGDILLVSRYRDKGDLKTAAIKITGVAPL